MTAEPWLALAAKALAMARLDGIRSFEALRSRASTVIAGPAPKPAGAFPPEAPPRRRLRDLMTPGILSGRRSILTVIPAFDALLAPND